MTEKVKDLNIPLNKRHYFDIWLFIAYIAISAYTIQPNSIASLIVTLVMVAPAFWFAFSGPSFLNNWASNSRYIYVSWLVFAIKLLFLYFVVRVLSPKVISIVSSWYV